MAIPVSVEIIAYLNSLYGEDASRQYLEYIEKDYAVYIRVNTLKTTKEFLRKKLYDNYKIETEELDFPNNLLKIKNGFIYVGKTIEHIIGMYYIQSLSSAVPAMILNPTEKDLVLDLCSAPGSKTTQMAAMMNNRGSLLVNESQTDRIKSLLYNVERMNLINTAVIHNKGENLSRYFSGYFDKILVDAPCSGLGIMQKRNEVNNWWTHRRALRLSDLQIKLLVAAIKMLKVGGEIVYSTCTMTPEENEFVIDKVLHKYPLELVNINIPLKTHDGFVQYGGQHYDSSLKFSKRIIPWEIDSEGFYIAKLKKIGETESPDLIPIPYASIRLMENSDKLISDKLNYLADHFGIDHTEFSKYLFVQRNDDLYMLNKDFSEKSFSLMRRYGIKLAALDKDGSLVLQTQAAEFLEDVITKNVFQINSTSGLKSYVEGGTIKTKSDCTGQCVVKFQEYLLGTAVITDTGIKSRFPRSKRTQEITKDFPK